MDQQPKWFSFDPTIHAGHVMTAITIIICTVGAWYGVKSDIATLTTENANRKMEIAEVLADAKVRDKENDAKFENLVQAQRGEVGKLRDDMNNWFLNLDQKLDRKADKR